MKKRYFHILIFLSLAILFSSTKVVAQKTETDNNITIESIVKDENGNPVDGAVIYGNEEQSLQKQMLPANLQFQ